MEHKPYSLTQGYKAASEAGNFLAIFVAALAGVVAHWIYGVLVAGLQATPQAFEFGTVAVVLARLVVSFIVTILAFVGIYQQVQDVDVRVRFFLAFSQGFALDAFAGTAIAAIGS
jgi:mannitol-specific phosphotransferase system IIBC component